MTDPAGLVPWTVLINRGQGCSGSLGTKVFPELDPPTGPWAPRPCLGHSPPFWPWSQTLSGAGSFAFSPVPIQLPREASCGPRPHSQPSPFPSLGARRPPPRSGRNCLSPARRSSPRPPAPQPPPGPRRSPPPVPGRRRLPALPWRPRPRATGARLRRGRGRTERAGPVRSRPPRPGKLPALAEKGGRERLRRWPQGQTPGDRWSSR